MNDVRPLSLHVPEPAVRPGGAPDFSNVKIPKAGTVPRPEVDVGPLRVSERIELRRLRRIVMDLDPVERDARKRLHAGLQPVDARFDRPGPVASPRSGSCR